MGTGALARNSGGLGLHPEPCLALRIQESTIDPPFLEPGLEDTEVKEPLGQVGLVLPGESRCGGSC